MSHPLFFDKWISTRMIKIINIIYFSTTIQLFGSFKFNEFIRPFLTIIGTQTSFIAPG